VADPALSFLDRWEHRAARWLLGRSRQALVRLSRQDPVVRDGLTLDPEVQLLLALRKLLGEPVLSKLAPSEARKRMLRDALVHAGETVPVGNVRELSVPGATGPLRARHYAPQDLHDPKEPQPLLVFFHGGGFVIGGLDTHDPACRALCRHGRMHVLAVDYRLAPEEPFPAAVEDARAAFHWACAHAAGFGADPSRVAVGGDSAGGNLAAVLSQLAKREGGPAPAAQLLLYPSVDRTVVRPSMELFADGFFLSRDDVEWYTRQYLGEHGKVTDPLVSPLLAKDVSGLAPALVVTAGFDPLRDEGEAYAAALRAAGTPSMLRRFDGLIHGFINLVGLSRACREALIEVAGALRAMLDVQRGQP
jgi:acetyl esterase